MGGGGSKAAFGSAIGTSPQGVVAHSSHYRSMRLADVARMSSYRDGHYCGVKWQCVEYARRWLLQVHGVTFASVGMAYEIFDLPEFYRPGTSDGGAPTPVRVQRYRDGEAPTAQRSDGDSSAAPQVGDVLLWHPQGHFARTGHVAIVVAVGADSETDGLTIALGEQNVTDASWKGLPFSRQLRVTRRGAAFAIEDPLPGAKVLGWVRPVLQ
uniref:Peptidase C51 domain-containing protein n=1 Tax=Neobodo designis TaxID=312471 RepID=A0A7S1QS36_NEODS